MRMKTKIYPILNAGLIPIVLAFNIQYRWVTYIVCNENENYLLTMPSDVNLKLLRRDIAQILDEAVIL